MAKKKKKDKVKKSSKKKKKLKLLLKLMMIVILGLSVYALWKPEVIQNENQRNKVIGIREFLIEKINSINSDSTLKGSQVLGSISDLKNTLPQELVVGDREIYVDEAVSAISSNLESLPVEQYTRFRASFCADLVATAAATPSE